jgi:tetratricopeptide (TPR) repeat protein
LAEHLLFRGEADEPLRLCPDDGSGPAQGVVAARWAAVRCRALLMRSRHEAAVAAGQRALDLVAAVPGRRRAVAEVVVRVHTAVGVAHWLRADRDAAVSHLGTAVSAGRAAGLRTLSARAMVNLGGVRLEQGRLDAAEDDYRRALEIMRATGDQAGAARALHATGLVRHYRGDPAGAVVLHEEAVALHERLGDRVAAAAAGQGRALALLAAGRVAAAEAAMAEAVAAFTPTAYRSRYAHALDAVGVIRLVCDGGLSAAAEEVFTRARDHADGDPDLEAMIAVHRAVGLLAVGRDGAAARLLAELPATPPYDVLPLEAEFARGALALARGNPDGAVAAADRMLRLVADHGHRVYEPAARRLSAAAARTPDWRDLPRMLWVAT